MGSPVPVALSAKPLHEAVNDFCGKLVKVVQPIIPAGFRAKVEFVVDNGLLNPYSVSVTFRPHQENHVKR